MIWALTGSTRGFEEFFDEYRLLAGDFGNLKLKFDE